MSFIADPYYSHKLISDDVFDTIGDLLPITDVMWLKIFKDWSDANKETDLSVFVVRKYVTKNQNVLYYVRISGAYYLYCELSTISDDLEQYHSAIKKIDL